MTVEQITTVFSNLGEGLGLAVFLGYMIRGLRSQVAALNKVVETQQKTLDAMERQVAEEKKLGQISRDYLTEIPQDIKKYKEVMHTIKDGMIAELEQENRRKEQKLRELSCREFGPIVKNAPLAETLRQTETRTEKQAENIARADVILGEQASATEEVSDGSNT